MVALSIHTNMACGAGSSTGTVLLHMGRCVVASCVCTTRFLTGGVWRWDRILCTMPCLAVCGAAAALVPSYHIITQHTWLVVLALSAQLLLACTGSSIADAFEGGSIPHTVHVQRRFFGASAVNAAGRHASSAACGSRQHSLAHLRLLCGVVQRRSLV